MAHIHSVYDTEPHFQIDKTSREVKNVSASKTTITQFDHNSERFTFEIPRFIDGHDMSLCNVVQVHYINIDSTDKTNKIVGVYTVDDLQLSPEDENIVICSWLISQNATQLAGPLTFLLRYTCSNDGVLDYAWNTARCTSITVSNGLYNGEAIIEEYFDILAVWEQKIVADVTDGIDKTIEEKVDNVKIVETATGSAITIDSSEAPIPYLKLIGKTTKDGNTLTSSGDSGSFEVGVYGKNLFDLNNCKPISSENVTISGDNIIIGAKNDIYGVYLENLPLEVGQTYTFSASSLSQHGDAYGFRFFYEDDSYSSPPKSLIQTITITKPVKWVCFYVGIPFSSTTDITISNLQVELGSQATPFEEYKAKQSITFTDTLRGIGDIADEKDFARGVKIQRMNEVTLDGSDDESWSVSLYQNVDGSTRFDATMFTIKGSASMSDCLCSGFKVVEQPGVGNEVCWCNIANTFFEFRIQTSRVSTVAELKAMLQANPIKVVYPLLTPIETALTEQELNAYRQLMTNKGTTTVLSECDVEMLYYVNKPNAQAIGDIHTQINKDYFKTLSLIAENVATVEETESESEE